jgi:dipeptidyl aminopeptidase/acylaminoacyl peptidase
MRHSLSILLLFFVIPFSAVGQGRPMTLDDLMSMRTLRNASISNNGAWTAYDIWPDRGNGDAIVKEISGRKQFTIPNGQNPRFSEDSRWLAATIRPDVIEVENASKPADRPKSSMAYLPVASGEITTVENVKSFEFTGNSRYLLIWLNADKPGKDWRKTVGSPLEIRALADGSVRTIPFVSAMTADSLGTKLFLAIADSSGEGNALIRYDVATSAVDTLHRGSLTRYDQLTWSQPSGTLAFVSAVEDSSQAVDIARLHVLDATLRELQPPSASRYVPFRTQLRWTDRGERLFFGTKPVAEKTVVEPKRSEWTVENFTDPEFIRDDRGLDVWHGEDPLIKPHERKTAAMRRSRTFLSVWHRDTGRTVSLADSTLPSVSIPENARFAVGTSNVDYQREITWFGNQSDVYVVDLRTGSRRMIAERHQGGAQLSPGGNWIVMFRDGHWHAVETATGVSRNLTEALGVPFVDEDHDSPSAPGGYGIAGWTKGDASVLIYDKFDLWSIELPSGRAVNRTETGRAERRQYRIRRTDEERTFDAGQVLLMTGYHDVEKTTGFYEVRLDRNGVTSLLQENKKLTFVAKAKDTGTYVYTRESYNEFPDIWSADTRFRNRVKQSNVNPVMSELAWGTSQLVEWSSMDGTPVQGVLILPGGYKPGTKIPVIVYFYELFSQRLHEYNALAVNHRPSFPYYASNGYAIFLPDVRYTQGLPGYSSTKYIVPGVQKLIDMGIADPKGIGIHGHSWSGYQAAHMITQTNMFAAAIVGAPVSNMTSAYNGIRWGSGLARQFQYEQQQSRIGRTMWEARDLYIENSPVFFADRIQTPTLIMFGDEDDAVPWYQGIELYLAMRRLDKDVIFLQYHGEPHHPQRYANKMDYTIRMKEYFDHYLKGAPAADWIIRGEAFD